jgi:signal recognition particle subunit SRP9
MVYISDFDEFVQRSTELFQASPDKSRYTIKYRDNDKMLVLKVTNNVTCLQYKTSQHGDMKKLEQLNNTMMQLMAAE